MGFLVLRTSWGAPAPLLNEEWAAPFSHNQVLAGSAPLALLHQSHVHLRGIVAVTEPGQTLLIPDPNRECCTSSALVLSLLRTIDFCEIARQEPVPVTLLG